VVPLGRERAQRVVEHARLELGLGDFALTLPATIPPPAK
jgi:hypothetical protein